MSQPPIWRDTGHPARLEKILPQGEVECGLSPRRCRIAPGKTGFCGVRGNVGGRLVTFTYGKGVHLTGEVIETEAVYHYAPGARILSLGNIGCNLTCSYCQNWKTSQARQVDAADLHAFTPEQVVDRALAHGIPILSWTYNDPVVWHEFVLDAARLARQAGLLNLFKSAFYITPEAVEELLPVIDIFSISLKSIRPAYYRRLTGGTLEPVLEGIRQVQRAGHHLEISNLMLTDISDDADSARELTAWVLETVGPDVPLHFVRFHPEFRLTDTVRTPIDRLRRAREIALEMGMRYVYLGNVSDTDATSTWCRGCGALLVRRFGLTTRIEGLTVDGHCVRCGASPAIRLLGGTPAATSEPEFPAEQTLERQTYHWRGAIASLHVQVRNANPAPIRFYHRPLPARPEAGWRGLTLAAGESWRFTLSREGAEETGCEIGCPPGVDCRLHEVFDRAHFPTIPIQQAVAADDKTALPLFAGRHLSPERLARLRQEIERDEESP
ncbi:MAG: AmmeMemoRadiSam system radical SAM enzyme [Magnetococcales bacterium]|nr:AmmeMemoRadiSam system radical SAM enzyme [Magnetococcales bacterium]